MSKSIGNVINPVDFVTAYGSDSLRMYITSNLPTERDGNFTEDLFKESFNINLANNIGNLLSRSSNMIMKYFDGSLKVSFDKDAKVISSTKETIKKYCELMDQYKISEAMEVVLKLGQECNKLIEDTKPWDLDKNGKTEELELFLATIREVIITISYLLKPVLVKNYDRMVKQMGVSDELNFENLLSDKRQYKKIETKEIIFERLK